jgi:hypothetical protein
MTTSGSSDARTGVQQMILDRAGSDPQFRDRLINDPKQAISEEFGATLPPSLNIRVLEEQPGEVVLVLPSQQTQPGRALSEAELEAVAGGSDCGWTIPICI